ncbi:hypothetical protein [Sphingobacterium paramultivorum]|uniref:hypothetical protein n=1 Tax=Sphingobacterium paramultivorum TaxID=2886510 RepID=UPI00129C8628|nr:hypothetical protein [Sphingobacterium paramultivorum]
MAEQGEGTKDVSEAQVRTDMAASDTLLLVNGLTKEVQRIPVSSLGEQIAPDTTVAPADYEDFFGL